VDKYLKPEQGLTFDVFKEDVKDANGEEGNADEPPAEAASDKVKFKAAPEENLPKTVFVSEVVREPRMHFFKVPKLGSYLAIRLEYKSCLFEEALDAAVVDALEMKLRIKEQEEEKKSFIEKLHAEEKDADGEGAQDASAPASQRKWEEIKARPFKTRNVQLVVCLNTLLRQPSRRSRQPGRIHSRRIQPERHREPERPRRRFQLDPDGAGAALDRASVEPDQSGTG
jgi:hypothetical protein